MKFELEDTQLFLGLVQNPISEDEWVTELEFSVNYHVTPEASKDEAFLIQFCGQYKTFSIPTGVEQYCSTEEHQDKAFEKYQSELNQVISMLKLPTTLQTLYAVTTPDVYGTDEAREFLDKILEEEDWA